jgi:hypothetical protein
MMDFQIFRHKRRLVQLLVASLCGWNSQTKLVKYMSLLYGTTNYNYSACDKQVSNQEQQITE